MRSTTGTNPGCKMRIVAELSTEKLYGLENVSSLFELQANRGKPGAGGGVAGVVNAVNSEAFRNLDEHMAVVQIRDMCGWNLGDVKGDAVDICVRFANVDEAR